ncbi:SH3 domain-containing protein [Emcibacter sp. SYSU 3D8]|uniref:SH3 domain-containing protein n=1 Tax=Emcibacter sp. SYSU 3D8 TaxID=3133969 RepID=UPI0031FEACCC
MKIVARFLVALCLLAALPAAPARAQAEDEETGAGGVTGLPLPRFVTLSSGKINMRVGPGSRYPIDWVYTRRGMPVEIIAEYELWRKVRDVDGAEGWMLKHMVSSKRGAIVTVAVATLRRDPEDTASPVLYAKKGVQGELDECRKEWCKLEVDGATGWLRKSSLWGAYSYEVFKE